MKMTASQKIGSLIGAIAWVISTGFFLLPHTGTDILPALGIGLLISLLSWVALIRFAECSSPSVSFYLQAAGILVVFVSILCFYISHVIAPEIDKYPILVQQLKRMGSVYRFSDWASGLIGVVGIVLWVVGRGQKKEESR